MIPEDLVYLVCAVMCVKLIIDAYSLRTISTFQKTERLVYAQNVQSFDETRKRLQDELLELGKQNRDMKRAVLEMEEDVFSTTAFAITSRGVKALPKDWNSKKKFVHAPAPKGRA